MADRPNKPALYKALGVLLSAIAAFLILPSIYEIHQATQASDWIPRNARITHAEVAKFGGGRAHDVPRYGIDMQGTFLDTNESFVLERIAFAQFNDLDQIRGVTRQHPAGSEVIVYVAPDSSGRVVLQKDARILPMMFMIVLGGACALLGIVSYLNGKKLSEYPCGWE